MTLLMERDQQNKQRFHQTLFTLAMADLVVKNITDSTALFVKPVWVDNLMVIIFLALIGIKLFTQKYTYIQLAGYFVLWLVVIYTCKTCYYYFLLFTALTVCAMQDIRLARTLLVTSQVRAGLMLIHVLVYVKDLIVQPWVVPYVYRNGIRRMTFYQGHPNTFSMYVCWAILEYIYARYEKMNGWRLALLWLINYAVYLCCNSNSSLIVMTLVCGMVFIEKSSHGLIKKIFDAITGILARYLYTFLFVFIVTIIVGYANGKFTSVFETLNKMFTGRLLFGAVAYDEKGFSLIGKLVEFPEKQYWNGHWIDGMIFDNSYIWLFISYGVVYLILISLAFIVYSRYMTNLEKIYVVAYALYTLMEIYVINTALVFPLLIVGYYMTNAEARRRKAKNTDGEKLQNAET